MEEVFTYKKVVEKSINQFLSTFEYIMIKGIEKDGEIKFIKACNKHGTPVYIHIDTKGYVSINREKNMIVKTFEGEEVISKEVRKRMTDERVLRDGTGIALECNNGDHLCILMRQDDFTVASQNYRIYEKPVDESIRVDDNPVSFVLIHLSEIEASHEEAIRRTDRMYEDLSKRDLKRVLPCTVKLMELTNILNTNTEYFCRQVLNTHEKLTRDTECLRTKLKEPLDKKETETVVTNIYARNKMKELLIKITDQYAKESMRLQELILFSEKIADEVSLRPSVFFNDKNEHHVLITVKKEELIQLVREY